MPTSWRVLTRGGRRTSPAAAIVAAVAMASTAPALARLDPRARDSHGANASPPSRPRPLPAGLAPFSRSLLLQCQQRHQRQQQHDEEKPGEDHDVPGSGFLMRSGLGGGTSDATDLSTTTSGSEAGRRLVGGGDGGRASGGGGDLATAGGTAGPAQTGVPTVLSSEHDVTAEARLTDLVAQLEEKRVARQRKLFEDMIVFEGGALADHPSLGYYLIMRDFLHFALYHAKWGYYPKLFRKYRQLMTTGYFDPIPYGSLRSQYDYERYVAKIHETTPSFVTPSQMFQPFYGWVMAEYLVTTLRAKFDPREPLIVYDVGAGTGALALSVLDYLAEHFPDVYARCQYHVIEMNPHLIQVLRNRLVHHYHHVHIHNISILNWRQVEKRRCVVLAMELFSGLPHDCIIWDADGACNEHWFGFQQLDNLSTAHERYYPLKDPVILRYLRYLNWMQEETFHNLKVLCLTGGRETLDPPVWGGIEPNMDDPMRVIVTKMMWQHSPFRTAWLPTGQMLLLEVLAEYFPRHHLFAADWSSVRQGLPGINGPVLQVKMRIAKDLYLRRPIDALLGNAGMVDIAFPTDFEHLTSVYKRVCGAEKEIACMTHPTFWRTYGGDKTALFTTMSGFNPLLEDFAPFHVFASHHPPEM